MSQYNFNGKFYEKNNKSGLGLGHLCFDIFRKYLKENPSLSYEELQETFNKTHNNQKVLLNKNDYDEWFKKQKSIDKKDPRKDTRYFDPIDYNNERIYFTTQWGNSLKHKNIDKFIDFARNELKYEIIKSSENIENKQKEVEVKFNNYNKKENNMNTKHPLNQILYGPPGTGKTYNTINKALEILDNDFYELNKDNRETLKAKFEEYRNSGQIEFVTFHQSYGYEEFVEGIKAKTDGNENITYSVEDGIFKKLCRKAKINQENSIKTDVQFKKDKRLEDLIYEFLGNSLEERTVFTKTQGAEFWVKELEDGKIVIYTEASLHTNGELTLKLDELYQVLKSDEEIKTSSQIAKNIFKVNNIRQKDTYYFALYKVFKEYGKNASGGGDTTPEKEELKNYILIIDEINRGNISKIFGELITLIEESKRYGNDEAVELTLPYSNEKFSVPKNLYILGTMNTANRSIALLDTALRRRFHFTEMMPNYEVLEGKVVDGINISKFLKTINERIEYLYDRDHMIGHAYFIDIKTKDDLDSAMKNKIIPLLQEYFYDDWEKIQIVLGDHKNQMLKEDNGDRFIEVKENTNMESIIGFVYDDMEDDKKVYIIKKQFTPKAYTKIYESMKKEEDEKTEPSNT